MDRRILYVLALMLLSLTGCAKRSGGNHICVDKTFTEMQKWQIRDDAFAAWNAMSQEYLGYDIIIDDGDCEDADGFQINDLNDERHMLYNGTRNDAYRTIISDKGGNSETNGWGTTGDVAIFTFRFYAESECLDATKPCVGSYYLYNGFRTVTMHELGHFVGLMHVKDPTALMYDNGVDFTIEEIPPQDIRQLCDWYDCIKDPPKE